MIYSVFKCVVNWLHLLWSVHQSSEQTLMFSSCQNYSLSWVPQAHGRCSRCVVLGSVELYILNISFLAFGAVLPLLETETLPSAKFFAECQISDTRQRPSLPSAALGKHGHSAKDFFAECQTLGKISTLGIGCPRNGVRSRPSLPSACCQALGKDLIFFKKNSLSNVPDLALGKDLKFF